MAGCHDCDENGKSRLTSRRSVLKLAGAAALVTTTGVAGASALPGSYDRQVNLGDEGLADGDRIDDYFDKYLRSGTELHVPAGEYRWNGTSMEGSFDADTAVVGEGDVVLNLTNTHFSNTVEATNGSTVTFSNVTVRGKTSEKSRFRLQSTERSTVVVDSMHFPDGSGPAARSRAFYCPPGHAGTVRIQNCHIEDFSNNGIYADAPGKTDGAGGRVVVENCYLRNNNIAGIRIGSPNSVARNCVVHNDADSPKNHGGDINMRGIRVRQPGENILIENCDVL